jgi:NAD(P)-dependent dehydrogenase (short-subunit alcohol dehydrogenase family)
MNTASLTVLVTGASSGIGKATAEEFARRGHAVFAAARRPSEPASNLRPLALDVTDAGSVRAAWAAIEEATSGRGVDVLVNNAGFALSSPIEELTDVDLRRQFDTNVFGLVAMTRTVLPQMRARQRGRIINVSSVLGRMTFPGNGAYSATKYAVESLSDALRQEVAGFGIEVIVIEPSFVATNIAHAADARRTVNGTASPYAQLIKRGDEYLAEQMAKAIPAERVALTIVDAAQRRRPRTRYVVPGRSRPVLALLTGLPDRLADRAKRREIGLAG